MITSCFDYVEFHVEVLKHTFIKLTVRGYCLSEFSKTVFPFFQCRFSCLEYLMYFNVFEVHNYICFVSYCTTGIEICCPIFHSIEMRIFTLQ